MSEGKEGLAKMLYEGFFDDAWADLHPHSIERAVWLGLAQKAIEYLRAPALDTGRGEGT